MNLHTCNSSVSYLLVIQTDKNSISSRPEASPLRDHLSMPQAWYHFAAAFHDAFPVLHCNNKDMKQERKELSFVAHGLSVLRVCMLQMIYIDIPHSAWCFCPLHCQKNMLCKRRASARLNECVVTCMCHLLLSMFTCL